jgi:hypothetical protein
MIQQTITIDILAGTAPYEYYISSDDPCVTFEPSSGTTSDTFVTTVASSFSPNCFDTTTAILYVSSADGCASNITLPLANPCDSLEISPISQISPYEFGVQASKPDCTNINFTWDYNDYLFELDNISNGSFTSTIKLTPKNVTSFPNTSNIYVTATDCKNCTASVVLSFETCKVTANTESIYLYCTEAAGGLISNFDLYTSANYEFTVDNNCNANIDWSTLEFTLPNNIKANPDSSGNNNPQVKFFNNNGEISTGIYSGYWTVNDEYGIQSTTGLINIIVSDCDNPQTLGIADTSVQVDCNTVSPGDTIEIDIQDSVAVAPGSTIDWSTWELLPVPVPTTGIPNITLGLSSTGRRVINYVTTSPTILPDVFAWTVCDTDGNCADATVYTILDCLSAPVATADTACSVCGQPVNIDVLANDTSSGPANLSSVTVASAPVYGTAVSNADGTITYTPNRNYEGSDSFTYNFKDTYGSQSNTATVSITVICAGENAAVTVCNN